MLFILKIIAPAIMSEKEGITDIGFKYINHDMCYPLSQIVGQMIKALESGEYDVSRVMVLRRFLLHSHLAVW